MLGDDGVEEEKNGVRLLLGELSALLEAAEKLGVGEPGAGDLVHHSDRGTQYLSIRYSDRLRDAVIKHSVGSVGDSYDNALAETVIGLYKAELIRHCGPWKDVPHVERETLTWVSWDNRERLFGRPGWVPAAEYEAAYHDHKGTPATVAGLT